MTGLAGELMSAEIAEQPQVLAALLANGSAEILDVGRVLAAREPRLVLFAARGTSDHAALYAKYLVEVKLGLPAGLVSPSATTLYGSRPALSDVLFIAVSQSGDSPDLVESLTVARACGATTVAVTNNVASALAQAAEFSVDVQAGVERAVAATKTYTAELLALFLLLAPFAERDVTVLDAAGPLAEAAHATLHGIGDLSMITARYRVATRLITTARGFSYPSALEGALKLMETSYLGAQAFSGADLLHGPMAMVDATTPVIVIASPSRGGAAMTPVIQALQHRGADMLLVGASWRDSSSASAFRELESPRLGVVTNGLVEELHPIVEILPLQSLALRLALDRGSNPDAPRGLSKVTRTR